MSICLCIHVHLRHKRYNKHFFGSKSAAEYSQEVPVSIIIARAQVNTLKLGYSSFLLNRKKRNCCAQFFNEMGSNFKFAETVCKQHMFTLEGSCTLTGKVFCLLGPWPHKLDGPYSSSYSAMYRIIVPSQERTPVCARGRSFFFLLLAQVSTAQGAA